MSTRRPHSVSLNLVLRATSEPGCNCLITETSYQKRFIPLPANSDTKLRDTVAENNEFVLIHIDAEDPYIIKRLPHLNYSRC